MINPSLLIVKVFTRSADKKDLDMLVEALEQEPTKRLYKEYMKINLLAIMAFDSSDKSKTKKVLLERIRKDKRAASKVNMYSMMKVAASIVLFIGLGYLIHFKSNQTPVFNTNFDKEAVTLQLSNGETKIITEEKPFEILDNKGNIVAEKKGNTILYSSKNVPLNNAKNVLKVPYGKTFNLVLADGTKVFLNSGSIIKYPTNFVSGTSREVDLSGEGYFDVAHNISKPFLVNSQDLQVKVLGTEFNVSNYSEDTETEVVLIEGKVDLSLKNTPGLASQNVKLKPGIKGTFNKKDYSIKTERVDVSRYISWLNGREVFVNETFENIITKLERKYNVIIINQNEMLAKERFNATIDTKKESIEQIMSFFKKVYDVKYKKVNNKIIIE